MMGAMEDASTRACWILDLDGVVWLADKPIPGAADAIAEARRAGRRVVFFTNNSFARKEELLAKFAAHHIDCSDDDLLSSAQAAARLLEPGERAYVLGGPGIEEALSARGVEVVSSDEVATARVDAVVVGLDMNLTMGRMTLATRAVARGARLVGTNDDATYPTPDGPLPGGGALLAAVRYASGQDAVVAGKPYGPAAALVAERVGAVAMMVGDRPSTDGRFARRLGAAFGLVRSGVTAPGVEVDDPRPDLDAADLAALVATCLGAERRDGPSAR